MTSARNAPCPCGSGKKQKRCCGAVVVRAPDASSRRAAYERLLDWAASDRFQAHVRSALAGFRARWRARLPSSVVAALVDYAPVLSAILAQIHLDLPVAGDGRSLARIFLDERGGRLSPSEVRAHESLATARLAVFRVRADAEGLPSVLERADGSGERVRDPDLPDWLAAGDVVALRLGPPESGVHPASERLDFLADVVPAERVLAEAPSPERLLDLWIEGVAAFFVSHRLSRGARFCAWQDELRVTDRGRLERRIAHDVPGLQAFPGEMWTWTWGDPAAGERGFLLLDGDRLIVAAPSEPEGRRLRADLIGHGAQVDVPPPRRFGAAYRRSHLPDLLDRGELSFRIPKEARALGLYLMRIAAAATARDPRDPVDLEIACRRRPHNAPCEGSLVATIDAEERVDWLCPRCGDAGAITGWQGTAADLRGRPLPSLAAGPGVHPASVEMLAADYARLLRLEHLTAPALRALLTVAYGARGEVVIGGERAELLALARCVALHVARAPKLTRPALEAYRTLHLVLSELGGGRTDLSLDAQAAEVLLAERAYRRSLPRPTGPDTTHRLSVELEDVAPPVRRTLEISSAATLADLHDALVLAMGWHDEHLHVFEAGGRRIGRPSPDDLVPVEDERRVLVAHALPSAGDALTYTYDFGDGWRHHVRVLEVRAEPCARPRLLAGERAAPPEDCGGPPGYGELLAALADPAHEEHARLRAWAGAEFDPERCDVAELDGRLARLAP